MAAAAVHHPGLTIVASVVYAFKVWQGDDVNVPIVSDWVDARLPGGRRTAELTRLRPSALAAETQASTSLGRARDRGGEDVHAASR